MKKNFHTLYLFYICKKTMFHNYLKNLSHSLTAIYYTLKKSKSFKYAILVQILFVNNLSLAQVQTTDFPYAFNEQISTKKIKKIQLPELDCKKYLNEDSKNIFDKVFRFAINNKVKLFFDSNNYIKADNKKIYYIQISSAGAKGIGLIFNNFKVSDSLKLFIFDKKKSYLVGAITNFNSKKSGVLPIEFIPSDTIILELQMPANSGNPQFYISDIGTAYRDIAEQSEWCEIDINCNDDQRWQQLKKSTLRIAFRDNKRDAYFYCSGSLIANTSLDNTPYILTANHCINSEERANSAIFYFNYEKIDCNGEVITENQSLSGASLIATTNERLDFSLLLLSVMPPANYQPFYTGWSRTVNYQDTSACIHHPAGDVKKISFDYDALGIGSFSGYDDNKHWLVKEWDSGTTEQGSSGSGLFNSQMQLIGTLSGGYASCVSNFNDVYQQFYHCWDDIENKNNNLKDWLDPLHINPKSMNGYYPYKNANIARPNNLKTELDETTVILSWEAPTETPDKYLIYRNLKKISENYSTNHQIDFLDKNGSYSYYITAVYGNDESKPSNISTVIFGDTSAIQDKSVLKVYPNPARNYIHIQTAIDVTIEKIELYNNLGQLLKVKICNNISFSNFKLPNSDYSIYFMKITTSENIYYKKITFTN